MADTALLFLILLVPYVGYQIVSAYLQAAKIKDSIWIDHKSRALYELVIALFLTICCSYQEITNAGREITALNIQFSDSFWLFVWKLLRPIWFLRHVWFMAGLFLSIRWMVFDPFLNKFRGLPQYYLALPGAKEAFLDTLLDKLKLNTELGQLTVKFTIFAIFVFLTFFLK